MNPVKNILVPTDFSEASADALRYALTFADAFGASLHVLHACQTPSLTAGCLEACIPDPVLFEQLDEEARQLLDATLTSDEKARYHPVLVAVHGDPAGEIVDYVRRRGDIDLIIMATHGRGGVSRLMMGSVADRVVREAPCPVLTLRELPVAFRAAA